MAKRLEELGISPTPWEADFKRRRVWDKDGNLVVKQPCKVYCVSSRLKPNARLIAAAPDGYEEMYNDCICLKTLVGRIDSGATIRNLRDVLSKMTKRMEAVLEKAAGEELVI